MRQLGAALAAAALWAMPALAGPVAEGPQAGDAIPHTLETVDQTGTEQSFETLKGANGAVLAFVRSADWCPYCQRQLIDLNAARDAIETHGYALVSISYDPVETLARFADKHDIGYTMLSDPESEIINAFGILNDGMPQDTKYYGVPHPAIYVVGAGGVIEAVLAEEDYKERPAPAEIIAAIEAQD